MPSYINEASATNRANSAILRIDHIIHAVSIPSSARLALIAEIMLSEPILSDTGVGAIKARREAAKWNSNNCEKII